MTIVFVHGAPETAAIWDKTRAAISAPSTALSLSGFGVPRPDGFGATKDDSFGNEEPAAEGCSLARHPIRTHRRRLSFLAYQVPGQAAAIPRPFWKSVAEPRRSTPCPTSTIATWSQRAAQ